MQRYRKALSVLFPLFLALSACTTPKPSHSPTAVEEMRYELRQDIQADSRIARKNFYLPSGISNALIPPIATRFSGDSQRLERHFDISANKMPAKAFFMGLVEGTRYNMVVNPKVNGEISLNVKNVTISQAMDMVRDAYGYEYRKTSYGYEVLPQELVTQLFTVNYLNMKRVGKSMTEVSSGQISEKVTGFSTGSSGTSSPTPLATSTTTDKSSGSSIDTSSKMDFWHGLETTVRAMVGTEEGRSVAVDAQAGIVIVRAYPAELHQVSQYLDSTQTTMNRQVILEAKILEVRLSNEFQSGIDWNLFGRTALGNGGIGQQGSLSFSDASLEDINLNDFNSMFTLSVYGNFGALIKLLQLQGNVQVLSSPRISTVNNQNAVIKVGDDAFYVTGVSTSNTIVGTNTLPSENVDLTPFFSGITLDVTPQISGEKGIILHIHPTISDVTEQQKNIVLGTSPSTTGGAPVDNNFTLPLARSSIRESDNVVRAKSGQIVVIGGLMQNKMTEQVAGVPFLARLPIFGPLFRHTLQTAEKSELVILLRPIIVDNRTWTADLRKSEHRFKRLDHGFHAGSFPEIFGTEAEKEDLR